MGALRESGTEFEIVIFHELYEVNVRVYEQVDAETISVSHSFCKRDQECFFHLLYLSICEGRIGHWVVLYDTPEAASNETNKKKNYKHTATT